MATDTNDQPPEASYAVSEPPELELLRELRENGATGIPDAVALDVIAEWRERHHPQKALPPRVITPRIIADAFLRLITADGTITPLQAGRRAYSLAHELKLGRHKTASELAERLKLPPARISETRKSLRKRITLIEALKTLSETSQAKNKL